MRCVGEYAGTHGDESAHGFGQVFEICHNGPIVVHFDVPPSKSSIKKVRFFEKLNGLTVGSAIVMVAVE